MAGSSSLCFSLLFILLSGSCQGRPFPDSIVPFPSHSMGPHGLPDGADDHHGMPVWVILSIIFGALFFLVLLGVLGWRLWVKFHPQVPVQSSVGSCTGPSCPPVAPSAAEVSVPPGHSTGANRSFSFSDLYVD